MMTGNHLCRHCCSGDHDRWIRAVRRPLQLTANEGRRAELLRVLGNYVNTLDEGEPGTRLFSVASDPNDENLVWVWEVFADGAAVQAHFEHDFFRALQLELADLLAEPVAVRPLAPVVHHAGDGVNAG